MPMPRWMKKDLKLAFQYGDKQGIVFLNRLWNDMRKQKRR